MTRIPDRCDEGKFQPGGLSLCNHARMNPGGLAYQPEPPSAPAGEANLPDAAAVQATLLMHGVELRVLCAAQLASTQDFIAALPGDDGSAVVFAARQTAARGRLGRTWHQQGGLAFSLRRELACSTQSLPALSPVLGAATVVALQRLGAAGLHVKWPNDLVDSTGAKLAGILIEARKSAVGQLVVIAGMGLNLHSQSLGSARLEKPATALDRVGVRSNITQLAGEILLAWITALEQYPTGGVTPWLPFLSDHDALAGRSINALDRRANPVHGVGAGFADSGAYRVQTADGIVEISAGQIERPATCC